VWKSGLEFEEIRATTSFSGSSWEAWKKNGSRQRLGELSDVLAAGFRFAGKFCCIRSSLKPFVVHTHYLLVLPPPQTRPPGSAFLVGENGKPEITCACMLSLWFSTFTSEAHACSDAPFASEVSDRHFSASFDDVFCPRTARVANVLQFLGESQSFSISCFDPDPPKIGRLISLRKQIISGHQILEL
jgi:hypothetical protein